MSNKILTQQYSTWGDKLLQHCDVLDQLQRNHLFKPITVQLAPTEACDSDCPFCSVGNRPKGKVPWVDIEFGLRAWKALGAKSIELTGGGNPLLYRDGEKTISDVVLEASKPEKGYRGMDLALKVGVITNSEQPSRFLNEEARKRTSWVRVSLAKLDEGKNAADYDFTGVTDKLALSYIFHSLSRKDILQEIAKLIELWPSIKFVRLAAGLHHGRLR